MEETIQEMLIRHYEKYYRLAYSYVHNPADAMDIVQEGAYKAILNSSKLKKQEYADTWLYRIMVNEAVSFLRKNRNNLIPAELLPASQNDTYEDTDLRDAIEMLDPLDRTIIVLRFFEDLPLDQIAEITGKNSNTVKSRLYRTLKKLKLSLTDERRSQV